MTNYSRATTIIETIRSLDRDNLSIQRLAKALTVALDKLPTDFEETISDAIANVLLGNE